MKLIIPLSVLMMPVFLSCSGRDLTERIECEGKEIELSTSVGSLLTKSTTTNTSIPFKLYVTCGSDEYVPVTTMTYDTSKSKWKWGDGSKKYYWPSDATGLTFRGVMDAQNSSKVTSRIPAESISVPSVKGSEDLCVCCAVPSKSVMDGPLDLVFNHAYTKLSFNLKAATAQYASSCVFKITSLTLTAKKGGTLSVASPPEWTSLSDTDTTYTVTCPDGKLTLSATTPYPSEPFGATMIVPQDGVVMDYSYEVYDSDSPTVLLATYSSSVELDLSGSIGNSLVHTLTLYGIHQRIQFSVSESKRVDFTKGNLYWDGSSFHFESSQTGYSSSWTTSHVSHFFWTSSTDYSSGISAYQPYAGSYLYSSQSSQFFCGDGCLSEVDGEENLFALYDFEWRYLMNIRNASTINGTVNARYALVKVNSVKGMLLFPDVFTWPSGAGTMPSTINSPESNWNSVNYTSDQFRFLDNAGCVFLPAAGYRDSYSLTDTGSTGYYWSSSCQSSIAGYVMYFGGNTIVEVYPYRYFYRKYGCSIRLVYEVN